MKNFYIDMIQHYQNRIQDKSIPILVRADFKLTVAYYKNELNKIEANQILHSKNYQLCH